jgi:RNA polymerase sigma factor (sigma-70 family)
VVTRNLCLDWHRREFGRHRVFESVARMPALEQDVFRALFVDLLPLEAAFRRLRPRCPGLTMEQVSEAAGRLQALLTQRQRWLLVARRERGRAGPVHPLEDCEAEWRRLPSALPDPETAVGLREERAGLLRALSKLTARERLLVRLRFEHGLTLDAIARLIGLDNAQRADREIRGVVERLRREVTESDLSRGKRSAASV